MNSVVGGAFVAVGVALLLLYRRQNANRREMLGFVRSLKREQMKTKEDLIEVVGELLTAAKEEKAQMAELVQTMEDEIATLKTNPPAPENFDEAFGVAEEALAAIRGIVEKPLPNPDTGATTGVDAGSGSDSGAVTDGTVASVDTPPADSTDTPVLNDPPADGSTDAGSAVGSPAAGVTVDPRDPDTLHQ